jgi:hypothetical protein
MLLEENISSMKYGTQFWIGVLQALGLIGVPLNNTEHHNSQTCNCVLRLLTGIASV